VVDPQQFTPADKRAIWQYMADKLPGLQQCIQTAISQHQESIVLTNLPYRVNADLEQIIEHRLGAIGSVLAEDHFIQALMEQFDAHVHLDRQLTWQEVVLGIARELEADHRLDLRPYHDAVIPPTKVSDS